MSKKVSYAELPGYLKRMVDRNRPAANGYLEKGARGRFRRVKEVSTALHDLAYDSGITYKSLAEFCDYLVMGCEYDYNDALDILNIILYSGKEQN